MCSIAAQPVLGMTRFRPRALARELGRDWIRVNAIAPSAVLTEGTDGFFGPKKDKLLQAVAAGQSLQKNLTTDDLVGTVLYLASRRQWARHRPEP